MLTHSSCDFNDVIIIARCLVTSERSTQRRSFYFHFLLCPFFVFQNVFPNFSKITQLESSIERSPLGLRSLTAGIEIRKINLIGRFTYITDTVRPHHRLRPRGKFLKLVCSDSFNSTCFDVVILLILSETFDLLLNKSSL